MIKNYALISIKEILSRVLRHPLLRDVTLEEAVQYAVDFLYVVGVPTIYSDKEEEVAIKEFRGLLPCDLISIIQVKEMCSGLCLRHMTDSFTPKENDQQMTFKTQGKVIYTSFPEGRVLVSYKAIPVDSEGFPLLHDNATLLRALEAYIKKEVFTVLFDLGKIAQNILINAQQDYAWRVAQCQSEYTIPSVDEMESFKNSFTTLLQRTEDFHSGFKFLGNKELYRIH